MTAPAFLLCAAALLPGENLVVNGRLEADQTECPSFWNPPENAKIGETVFFEQGGGPDGIPCVRFANHGRPFKECSFRQGGYTLVPGARYRLSAKVRTKGFKGRGMVYVINVGWYNEAGLGKFPEDSPWTPYEIDITAPGNQNVKNYLLVMCALRFTGEIAFADLSLRPLDDAAKKGSAQPNTAASEKEPRFFPWSPYLTQIDAADRRVSFRFAGELPKGDAAADYTVTMRTPDGETSAPLVEGVNDFRLPGSLTGGRLSFDVCRHGVEKPLLSGSFPFRMVEKAAMDTRGHRRLNNLVTEVLSAPLAEASTFSTTRDGWVFLRVEGAEKCPAVDMDGKAVFAAGTSRREAFREVKCGVHRLSAAGAKGGRIVVRQIAEILNYPSCADSPVGTNPSYGWDFFSRHVMPNCTTHNGGRIPKERWGEFKLRGGDFLDNFVSRHMDAETFAGKVASSRSLARPECDGLTLDEHLFGDAAIFGDYVGGMRRLAARYDGGRKIYTWMVQKPMLAGLDREIFALAANASPGGAKILSEIYCRSRATEAEARRYIADYILDAGRRFREMRPGVQFYPGAMQKVGVVLANFSQIPTLSVWHHPQVDFKRFLDMQFNALANDPAFDGLGLVGAWGSYYSDEEVYRWTFMLARHYCIEGRTDMLSDRHGLKYLPGILDNGDFNDGLDGWRVEGDVCVRTVRGFAENVERRWGGAASGESFAVLAKKGDCAARLEQKLKGLVPGRMYSLDVVCFDAKDAASKRHRPARHPVAVTLGEGAEKDARLSWVFVDRRPKEGVRGWGVRVNRHHLVFTARAGEVTLAIDNSGAQDGSEMGVNWVGAWPYVRAD